MNRDNQESYKDAFVNIPMKRKCGRPRKHPRLSFNHGENFVLRNPYLKHRENAHVPPGSQGMNRNHFLPVDPINNTNDVMVGQVVSGVIEAAFDAGYLLTVKVGNSETSLRGAVFKPGQYVPVSVKNDVAPNVQMVRRNEIPFPAGNYSQVHGYNSRPRERNEQPVNAKGKQVASMGIQTTHPVIPRNIYQHVHLPNGRAVANQPSSVPSQVTHLESSKVKLVTEAVIPSNESTTNQVQMGGNQVFPLQAQTSHPGMLSQPPAEVLLEAEAKSMKLPGMPFDELLTEVIKRIHAPSQSAETQIGDKNDDTDNAGQGLSVEPLQTVQPNVSSPLASLSKPFENFRTGKMTELLRAVQENMMENQAPQAEEQATGSRLNFDKLKSPEAEVRDQENNHSKKHSQASSV